MKLLSVFSSTLFISGVLGIVTASAATTTKVYRVTNVQSEGALHLRSAPGVKANVVLELPYDARWIVPRKKTGKFNRSQWQKVNWNDHEGWVNTSYIAYDPEATAIAEQRRQCVLSGKVNKMCCGYPKQMSSGKFYPVKVFDVSGVEPGQSLNMRVKPGVKSKIMATLPHNATGIVKLPGQSVNLKGYVWQKVRWNGRNGWVNAFYLKHNQPLSAEKNNIRKMCGK